MIPPGSGCPACGTGLPAGAKFCLECGRPVAGPVPGEGRFSSPVAYTPRHLVERVLTSRSALEGERKLVTVLFCDLAGSTGLAERLGPDGMHRLLDRFFELALAEVHRYEGTINQFLGDGFMALFGAPVAHEDHARRAVLAAVALQRGLRERGADLGVPGGMELAARMGLNTGPVVVGKIGDNLRMDYTAVGDTTNLAARLQQVAEPGSVYAAEATVRAARGAVECEALGMRSVKGRTEPVAVYRVSRARQAGESARPGREIGSPLVGRDAEVGALRTWIERLERGEGGVVCLVGEAGLGKSRLVAEVRRAAPGPRWLEGRALSFGRTISYWPFLEILRADAGILETDGEAESWAKLERRVAALGAGEDAELLPYLATLLGVPVRGELVERVRYLDGQAMGRQIFRTVRRIFERLARERPTVLVFEDLHWADQSSVELLEHLLPLIETVPLLLCLVSRPDAEGPVGRLSRLARERYGVRAAEVALAPLLPADGARLVENLLEWREPASPIQQLVLGKAEGNPFFIEEVVRSLVDLGAVVRDEAGAWRATARLEDFAIPDTVQGVIMARIDRLDENLKHVLKLASVIGRSFFYRLLRAISDAGDALDGHLGALQQLELIRERRRLPELEYVFKHALAQEATYESVLVERRRQLHRRVGECIEALFADRLDEFSGILAYHYARAEDWTKAQEYLFKAGDQAGRIAGDAEALAHYRQAADAYGRAFGDRWDPLQRAGLERKIGEALLRRGEHRPALEHLERALEHLQAPFPRSRAGIRLAIVGELLRQLGHRLLPGVFLRHPPVREAADEERTRVVEAMGWIDYFVAPERFILSALNGLNVAERIWGDSEVLVRGCMSVGLICDNVPAYSIAAHYHQRAMRLADRLGHPLALGYAYLGAGVHEDCLGRFHRSREHYRRAATAFRGAGHLRGWGVATLQLAWGSYFLGAFGPAFDQARELERVGQDALDRQLLAWGLIGRGWVERCTGPLEQAIGDLQRAIELFASIPDYPGLAQAQNLLGACHLRAGRLQEALPILEQAGRLVRARRLRGTTAWLAPLWLAAAHLAAVEERDGAQRVQALRDARRSCRAAMRQGRMLRCWLPMAVRLRGTLAWLDGKRTAAEQSWQRSLAAAEELGLRYELGSTHLEMGRRLGDREHLERAARNFAETGAELDLATARELLSRVGAPAGPAL